jgi:prevent-host-death family protein
MLKDQIISITDLRQNATQIVDDVVNFEKIVVVHNDPKAVIINVATYDEYKELVKYKDLLENILFLLQNKSLDFLKEEPNLYDNY